MPTREQVQKVIEKAQAVRLQPFAEQTEEILTEQLFTCLTEMPDNRIGAKERLLGQALCLQYPSGTTVPGVLVALLRKLKRSSKQRLKALALEHQAYGLCQWLDTEVLSASHQHTQHKKLDTIHYDALLSAINDKIAATSATKTSELLQIAQRSHVTTRAAEQPAVNVPKLPENIFDV